MERSGDRPRTVPPRPRVSRHGILFAHVGSPLASIARVAILVLLAAAGAPPAAAAGASWTQPGYSATHQSYNRGETEITAANVATLGERWRVPNLSGTAAPVVADDRVLITDDGDAVALATDDGRELWRTEPDFPECGYDRYVLPSSSSLTVTYGCIFGSAVRSIAVATGVASDEQPTLHASFLNLAARHGDVFSLSYLFGSGGPLLVRVEGCNGFVYFGGLVPLTLRGPTLLRDHLFVTIRDFSSPTGRLLAFARDARTDPASSFGLCQPAWEKTIAADPTTPVGFRGGRVAIASTDGTLAVHDAATGDLQWSANVPATLEHAPAVTGKRIYLATRRGVIRVFAGGGCGAATCPGLFRMKVGGRITGQPVVAGDVVYAGTRDGRVVAFDAGGCGARVCDPLWSVDLGGGAITRGPIVVGGAVYAGTANGDLVAFGLPG